MGSWAFFFVVLKDEKYPFQLFQRLLVNNTETDVAVALNVLGKECGTPEWNTRVHSHKRQLAATTKKNFF